MFPVLFAIGRLPGWIAHWKERHGEPRRRRSAGRARSTPGPTERKYVPIDQRDGVRFPVRHGPRTHARRSRTARRGARVAARATCRGSTARACRRGSTISPKKSRSDASGRRSSRAAGSSARPGPRSTAGAAAGRSGTTSSPRSWRERAHPSSSAGSASTSSGRRCSRTAPTSRRRAGCPRILDASEIWCQLFSEPGAGSDLTSLSTRGRTGRRRLRRSTDRRCGRATPSSRTGVGASRAPIPMPRRARASRRSSIDMHAPGVEVRPLRQITDESEFNEVFFADVFVPDDRLVGPLHEGWRVANSTLTHERGVNPRQLVIHSQLVDELFRLAAENGALDDPRLASAARGSVRRSAPVPTAQLAIDLADGEGSRTGTGRQHQQALVERDEQAVARHRDGRRRTFRNRCGSGAVDNPGDGTWQRSWLYYQASSIWAGTNEIQRNVIGESTLGLPREKTAEPIRDLGTYYWHATTTVRSHRHRRSRARPRRLLEQHQILERVRRPVDRPRRRPPTKS